MPYLSRRVFLRDVRFILFAFISAQILFASPLFAAHEVDISSGLDQSFTAGYAQKSFARSFHKEFDAPLEAETGWDNWKLHKGFNVSGVYDSNIFSARKDEEDDFIVVYTPTIGLSRKGEGVYFETFYDLSYAQYTDNDKLSRFNNSLTTNLGRDFSKLKVSLSNNFKPDTAYNTGERTELRSAEGSRVVTYSDNANLRLAYGYSPKTTWSYNQGLNIYYFPTGQNSQAANRLSSRTWSFNPAVSYKWTSKISLSGQYRFETVDFFEGGIFDSDSHYTGIGVAGRVAPKTNVSLDGGFRTRSYDQANINGDEDFEARAAVSQQVTQKLLVTLWASRALGENLDTSQSNNVNDIKDFFGVNATLKLAPRINVEGGTSYGFSKRDGYVTHPLADAVGSDTAELENEYIAGDVEINWNPRQNLAMSLAYKYFDKQSSFGIYEYNDHKVLGSVRVAF